MQTGRREISKAIDRLNVYMLMMYSASVSSLLLVGNAFPAPPAGRAAALAKVRPKDVYNFNDEN